MARKTKEIIPDEKKENIKKKKSTHNQNAKVSSSKKIASKSKSKNITSKQTTVAKSTDKSKKRAVSSKMQKSSVSSKSSSKKEVSLNTSMKINESKALRKKDASKKLTVFTPEYYDLPYRYNQTVVKILAQTPTNLFIYWDISDMDRENLKKTYGEHVFEITKPVLIVHNVTMNYSFEIDINDFANSWYLHINDSKCEYKIELGRRPIPINYNYISNFHEGDEPIKPIDVPYIYVSSSNKIESPNDKILFNKEQNMIYFRNVKTNQVTSKDIASLTFIQNIGKFYKVSDLYKEFYKNEEILNGDFVLSNPGSGNPSSGSLSSRFN